MFWAMQVMTTNAYVAYRKYMLILKMKQLSHYEFLESVCHKWWIQKHRDVWGSSLQRTIKIPYYRFNVIDIYNHNMNNVDISDQLRVIYWWYHWTRKRKL